MWSLWKACQLLYMCFTCINTEWACLRGWVIEGHIKHISLLSGSMSSKNIIWILHGVLQHHHLKKRERKTWIGVQLVTSYYSFYIHCIHPQSVYQNHSSLLLATWQYTFLVITASYQLTLTTKSIYFGYCDCRNSTSIYFIMDPHERHG